MLCASFSAEVRRLSVSVQVARHHCVHDALGCLLVAHTD